MRLSSIVTLGVASLATCTQWSFEVNEEFLTAEKAVTEFVVAHPRSMKAAMATLDAGSVSRFLKEFNNALTTFDRTVDGITKQNVATQMDQVVSAGKRLSDIATKYAPTIKSTGPINTVGAVALMQPGMALVRSANSTLRHFVEKRQIILDAKQEEKVKEALLNGKPGMIAMLDAMSNQLTPQTLKSIENATGTKMPPLPPPDKIRPVVDNAIDYAFKVYKYSSSHLCFLSNSET